MYSRRKTRVPYSETILSANKLGRHNVTSPLKLGKKANDHEKHHRGGISPHFTPRFRIPQTCTTPCNNTVQLRFGNRSWRAKDGGREQKKEREKEKKEGKRGKNSCREMGIRCGVGRESGRRGGPIVQLIP